MSTYRLDPNPVPSGVPGTIPRMVLCERCLGAVGVVPSIDALSGLPGRLAVAMWPELKDAVRFHDAACAAVPEKVRS